MADRSPISNDHTGATIKEAEVAIRGSSRTMSRKTAEQLSSSGKVAQETRIAKPREAFDKAVRDAFLTPKEDAKEKK